MDAVPQALRAHVRALETHMAQLRACGAVMLGYDAWDRWGSSTATAEYRAYMEAEFADANDKSSSAEKALTALVEKLRAEVPSAVIAWADAHEAYLTAFIAECAQRPDDQTAQTAKSVAEGERAGWAEVRAGAKPFVQENPYYVTINAERFRALFGIDP